MLIALVARAAAAPPDATSVHDAGGAVDGDGDGGLDAGAVDAGAVDAGAVDAGAVDAGALDAGALDGDDELDGDGDADADAGAARLAHGLAGATRSHDAEPDRRPASRWGRFDVSLAWRRTITGPAGDRPQVIDQLWLLATWRR